MSDTGSPSESYETQFLEGLYIAVRTRGVPIYKVFLLLTLFVYSFFYFLFYFILFCFYNVAHNRDFIKDLLLTLE